VHTILKDYLISPVCQWVVLPLAAVFGVALALVLAVSLVLSVFLVLVLVAQAVGGLKRVPFSYNLRNLFVRWPVTLLTVVAFALVVGLMTVMLAFVNGMYKLSEGSGHPDNVIVLADGSTDELFSNLGYGDVTEIRYFSPDIKKGDDGEPLVSFETYMVVNQPVLHPVPGSPPRRFVQLRGLDSGTRAGAVHKMPLKAGQWFDPVAGAQTVTVDGKEVPAAQAVVGEGIARELGKERGKPSLEVGDVFDLGPSKWIAVGVMNSGGSMFDSEIWAKRSLCGEKFGKESTTTVVMTAIDPAAEKDLPAEDAERLRAIKDNDPEMRDAKTPAARLARYLTKNYKKPAVQGTVETDYYSKLNGTNQQFLYGIMFVAAVMAIGGVFGIMNTMFAAINGRIKDIGVLRILGYTPLQVLVSFFAESLMIALLGAVLGLAVGSLANGWTATGIMSGGMGGGKTVVLRLVVDQAIWARGLLFGLGMGAVGGLLPALRAMFFKPLDTLR
jgi:ABC-type antimicrobial peptide transport system permease subunit